MLERLHDNHWSERQPNLASWLKRQTRRPIQENRAGKTRKIRPSGAEKRPCDHLCQVHGTGPYRSGTHSKPSNDGKYSHHMLPDVVSPLKHKDGPAIQMDPKAPKTAIEIEIQGKCMAPLAEEKMAEMQETGERARAEISAGNPDAAQILLEKAWQLIPLPRAQCHDSVSLARGALRLMAFSGKPSLALRWINELKSLPVSDLDPGPDFLQGVTYYELGDLNRAYEHFQRSFTMSKGRCCVHEEPKYLTFYKEHAAKGNECTYLPM